MAKKRNTIQKEQKRPLVDESQPTPEFETPNNNAGRPGRKPVPYPLAKILWDEVWKKFTNDHADKIGNMTLTAKLETLAQKVNVGTAPVKELKKDLEQMPVPDTVQMSQTAVTGLCDYIPDEDLKRNIFAIWKDPSALRLARYFGRYRVYWREKRDTRWVIRNCEMQLGAADTRLWGGLADVSVGSRVALKNMNLSCSVEDENKISQFIFNVGTVVENNLGLIPGLCITINASAVPTMVAVLLVAGALSL